MATRKRSIDARCRRALASVVLLAAALFLLPGDAAAARQPRLQFLVSFPATAHSGPITGRAFVVLTRSEKSEPRLTVFFLFLPPHCLKKNAVPWVAQASRRRAVETNEIVSLESVLLRSRPACE